MIDFLLRKMHSRGRVNGEGASHVLKLADGEKVSLQPRKVGEIKSEEGGRRGENDG